MKLQGVITIDDTIRANKEGLWIRDILIKDINTTAPDTVLTDIMGMATKTRFPIAVVDDSGSLKGIVSNVHVLSSML